MDARAATDAVQSHATELVGNSMRHGVAPILGGSLALLQTSARCQAIKPDLNSVEWSMLKQCLQLRQPAD